MRLSAAIAIGLLGLSSPMLGLQPSSAVTLSDGKTYFTNPPRLQGASATHKSARAWGSIYYFTMALPADAGEPLQQVTIAQQNGFDQVKYYLEETYAFEGNQDNDQGRIKIQSATVNQTGAVTVVFATPVTPGQTVTIALRPVENPSDGGVYLFGITAFPPGGEKAYGQFLGYGRINIYERLDSFGRGGFGFGFR